MMHSVQVPAESPDSPGTARLVKLKLQAPAGNVPVGNAVTVVPSEGSPLEGPPVTHAATNGEGNTRPEDYLAAFTKFVNDQRNQLAALTVVCTRPRNLTRAQLRELQLKLTAAGYSEAKLRTAWRDWKNQDIAATIIGFIRQRALGSPLVPYSERVDRAVAKVLAAGT